MSQGFFAQAAEAAALHTFAAAVEHSVLDLLRALNLDCKHDKIEWND